MSYTINPNAKNKWARNAENTMDLSLETDASSVYLDNGRTLEQEIGEGSMVSNVTTVDTSMSKIIDGTLDGAYESLVFKGKSLVNVIGKITVSNNAIDNRDGSYTINKNTTYSRINILGGNPMIKVNTPYYFTVIISNGTLTNLNVDVGTSVIKQQLGSGKYLITLTEKSFNIEANRLFWYQSLGTTSEETVTIYPILVEYQQGMENWDIPYFTGLCDVKMPILRNVGKNLFDKNTMKTSWWANQDGVKKDSGNTNYSILVPATQNKVYSVSFDVSNRSFYAFLDKNYNTLLLQTGYVTKTAPQGTKYLLYYLHNENIDLCGDIQLEEAIAKTAYEDHKTNILRTPETIVLRSLPSGVRDELNLKTGEYIKRIGEIVLDGTQDMSPDSNGVYIQVNDVKRFLDYRGKIACDKLPVIPTHGHLPGVENGISGYASANGHLGKNWLYIKINNSINKNEVREWLTQNLLTVQYELVEPITTIIEPLTIPFAYQNGHIILESGHEGQSLLPTLEYSTVVNKTGQIESVAKTIQAQEKQLTMLEKMLIQNIINLDYNNTLLTLKNEMEEML